MSLDKDFLAWSKSRVPLVKWIEVGSLEEATEITNFCLASGLNLIKMDSYRTDFFSSFVLLISNNAAQGHVPNNHSKENKKRKRSTTKSGDVQ